MKLHLSVGIVMAAWGFLIAGGAHADDIIQMQAGSMITISAGQTVQVSCEGGMGGSSTGVYNTCTCNLVINGSGDLVRSVVSATTGKVLSQATIGNFYPMDKCYQALQAARLCQ